MILSMGGGSQPGNISSTCKTVVFAFTSKSRQRNGCADSLALPEKGTIIEEYENDYPYPSCLVYGISVNNKILHIVCGFNGEELWIITAYYPNRDEWNEDMKTRKESK